MREIAQESADSPQVVTGAPERPKVRRLDEVRAARKPRLRWRPDEE
jgi:glycine dehydrogenase subunit 2